MLIAPQYLKLMGISHYPTDRLESTASHAISMAVVR